MKQKIVLFSLIGEFVIIVILGILIFNVEKANTTKCDKINYVYRDNVEYSCLSSKNVSDTNTYQIKINIVTDIKGKITDYQKLDVYAYTDDSYYKSMRDTYKIDSKYSVDFEDNTKTIIIDSSIDTSELLGTSYMYYEEFLVSDGFTCSLVD